MKNDAVVTRRPDQLLYGVQYYPEHWPRERWAVDARMMRDAGVTAVRMGEFAWSAYEPAEGAIDFAWMDEAIALLADHGIRTILCTCSRTPPPWLYHRYPDAVNRDRDGHPRSGFGRYAVGLQHPAFRERADRIDRAVIDHFAGRPAVAGWQVDNEVGAGNDCSCHDCIRAFRDHLERTFGSVAKLHAAWGTDFWSQRVGDFAEVPGPGGGQPQLELAYRRYLSGVNAAFARVRTEWIHAADPDAWVTTNCQSIGAGHTDARELIGAVDLPGMNHYPPRTPEFGLDLYRDRTGLLVLEQFTRLQHVDAGPGRMRLWAWMAIAHGATGINFFRWRQCRWGQEQFADGILPHAGQANRLYAELARLGEEIGRLGTRIAATAPRARVAVLYGYDSRWALQHSRYPEPTHGLPEAVAWHEALLRRNVTTDVLDPRENLAGYALVVAPRLWVVDEPTAANLHAFVAGGGTLVLTAGSGVVDEHGTSFDAPRPGPLADLVGATVTDLLPLDAAIALAGDGVPGLAGEHGTVLADELHPEDAAVLATFADGWRRGLPAVTRRRAGAGSVCYVATRLDEAGLDAATGWLCDETGIAPVLDTPDGVTAYARDSTTERLVFVLNSTNEAVAVPLPETWTDAASGEHLSAVTVPATDLRILSAPA